VSPPRIRKLRIRRIDRILSIFSDPVSVVYYGIFLSMMASALDLLGLYSKWVMLPPSFIPLLSVNRFRVQRVFKSFAWSFIAIIGAEYVSLVFVFNLGGLAELISYLFMPLLAVCAASGLLELGRRISAGRRGGGAQLSARMLTSFRSALFYTDSLLTFFTAASLAFFLLLFLLPVFTVLGTAFSATSLSDLVKTLYSEKFIRRMFTVYDAPITRMGSLVIVRGVNYGILVNSLLYPAIVTVLSTALGVSIAFILARYDFYGRTVFRILATAPLFTVPFVNAYAAKVAFGSDGVFTALLRALRLDMKVEFSQFAGLVLVQTISFFPIVYMNAYASFLSIDPSLEEQAENLGCKGLRLFFTVTLPLALPGIAAGSILVFIFSMEDLGAPIIFNIRDYMSRVLYDALAAEAITITPSVALSGVLMLLLALVGFITIRTYISLRRYAMVSRGGRWNPRVRRLGVLGHVLVYTLLLPVLLFALIPQITIVLMALRVIPVDRFGVDLSRATAKYLLGVLVGGEPIVSQVWNYFRNTFLYAFVAVMMASVISLASAYTVARSRMKLLSGLIDSLTTLPIAMPGVVVALGYYATLTELYAPTIEGLGNSLNAPWLKQIALSINPLSGPPIFQVWIVLILAFSVRRLPYIARSVFAGLQQIHESLEEAAMNLGAKRWRVVRDVVVPLTAMYIISGALIGFIYTTIEVSTSVMLGRLNRDQAPITYFLQEIYISGTAEARYYAAAVGVYIMLLQLAAVIVSTVLLRQRYAFIGL